ncbi:hypothetical protein B0T17DRAFT_650713 [Bombardia bombarda]|uniref:Trichothecene 3-O-acetyltransferase-like N-terminal domain-containing protein n=1 Tax=Bombardia bombarda TaxID=252184 RepID=A0AA40CEH0_9PEZI|nr:hypothetical protein B0T17DRAFT_650713 [Bombardia bombarda]
MTSTNMDLQHLSPLDQLIPRAYFGEILCFPSTDPRVFDLVRNGLRSVAVSIPYLTSLVIEDESCKGSGKIKLSEPGRDTIHNMLANGEVKDKETINYQDLRAASFPGGPLNRPIFQPQIPPLGTLPAPVMRAKVTCVPGGFMLSILVNHSVFDGASLAELLTLWSKSCHLNWDPEKHTPITLDAAHLDRKALLAGATTKPKLELPIARPSDIYTDPPPISPSSSQNLKSNHSPPAIKLAANAIHHLLRPCLRVLSPFLIEPPAPPCPPLLSAMNILTTIYRIPSPQLYRLKVQINHLVPKLGLDVDFVSTNDVLCALIWSAATLAMAPPPPPPPPPPPSSQNSNNKSNKRRLSEGTTATSSSSSSITLTPSRSLFKPNSAPHLVNLAHIAAAIRRAITSQATDATMTSLLRYLDHYSQENNIQSLKWRPADRMFDFYISSWTDQAVVYGLDGWGGGVVPGMRCEAIRCLVQHYVPAMGLILPPRPRVVDKDGLVVVAGAGGGEEKGARAAAAVAVENDVEIVVTLEEKQMERLRDRGGLMAMFGEVIDTW